MIGRDIPKKMHIDSVCILSENPKLKQVLTVHEAIFDKKHGRYKHDKIKINKPNIRETKKSANFSAK